MEFEPTAPQFIFPPCTINLAERSRWLSKYRRASCASDKQAAESTGSHKVPWSRLRAGSRPVGLSQYQSAGPGGMQGGGRGAAA